METPLLAALLQSLSEIEELARPLQANQIAGTQISLLMRGATGPSLPAAARSPSPTPDLPDQLEPFTRAMGAEGAVVLPHAAPLGSVVVTGPLAKELAQRTGPPTLGAVLLDWGFAEHVIRTIEHAVGRGLILLVAPRCPDTPIAPAA